MKNKSLIFITVISLLIGLATGLQAQVSTGINPNVSANVDPEVQSAYERLLAYQFVLNKSDFAEQHKGKILDMLKKKVEAAIQAVNQVDKIRMQVNANQSNLIKEQMEVTTELSDKKWDQEDVVRKVLEDIKKLRMTLKTDKKGFKKGIKQIEK